MKMSIMITTRNRLSDLKRTLEVLLGLDPAPFEILLTADGCTDGTEEYVLEHFPAAKLIVNAPARGSVGSRDRMLREATGDLVLSLDDDSHPEQADCLERIAQLFLERPQIAVAHFPQHTDECPETLSRTDFGPPRLTRSFANSGACFRRSVYLRLPGFEPYFFHAYEEPDYALQCHASGYEVYFCPSITIRHHYTRQSRSQIRTHHYHARNECWSTLMRCPFPYSFAVCLYRVFSQFKFVYKFGPSWAIREPVWWWRALCGIPFCLRKSRPFSWVQYKNWLSLP